MESNDLFPDNRNVQIFTLVVSVKGRTDQGKSIVQTFRLRADQVPLVRDLISTPQDAAFLALPTADLVVLVNLDRLIGIRLLSDLGALEMTTPDAEQAIPIPAGDFGKNAVEVEALDDPDPSIPEVIFYLAEKLDDHDQSELAVMDLLEEEVFQAAEELSAWEYGDPLFHILDDDGEDVWLNPTIIALATFKTSPVDDLFWLVMSSNDEVFDVLDDGDEE